eukprot:gnl/MRDRNA2_/MRDRNA2_95517_c0_seq1.p1 gnl/MRDRNA2_/MRDRNA2_95517_c0~~gnl/MRDRNA2_/MRDRNA2_95517_c0_seq1.p1  ORF type:complete len:717 (+),score=131.82 gnl/MRDRNA2_/MRDRNA2_95517_c0_seq1:51-2201(+)
MPPGAAPMNRRRKVVDDDDRGHRKKDSSTKFICIVAVGVLLIVGCQVLLFSMHTDHHLTEHGRAGDDGNLWTHIGTQDANITILMQEYRQLQADFRALKAKETDLEARLANQGPPAFQGGTVVANPGVSDAGGAAAEMQRRELEDHRKLLAQMQTQIDSIRAGQPVQQRPAGTPAVQAQPSQSNQGSISQATQRATQAAPAPARATSGGGNGGSPPQGTMPQSQGNAYSEMEFPDDWKAKFSQAELAASAQEAENWMNVAKGAMVHTWNAYRQRAMGHDEIKPISGQPGRAWGHCAMTMLDALSTMWVMGLKQEFDEATEWIERNLDWDKSPGFVSFFETTIRVVGGLLSAHAFSGKQVFLDKSRQLSDRMMKAFKESSGFPMTQVSYKDGRGMGGWYSGTILAEAGTIQLEFRYLSQQTGNSLYQQKADRAMRAVFDAAKGRGLVPWGLSGDGPPHFQNTHITFGAMGDSYYEYLLKMWVQTGKTEPEWKNAWKKAMSEMKARLIKKTRGGLTYIVEEQNGNPSHKMDHLACFAAGMLIYGARELPKDEVDPDWEPLAEQITETCFQMYHRQPTHLSPECVAFDADNGEGKDMRIWPGASHYLLRPETAEAIYYMFYYTGDPKYRRMAGEIMMGIEQWAKSPYGYSAIADVRQTPPHKKDEMESFFLAETLKYLYLTFVPNPRKVVDFNEFVFNTEAHPLRIHRRNQGGSGFLAR